MTTELEERREALKALLLRVPARVMSAGVVVTGHYVSDVYTASRAVESASLTRINESIEAMKLWHDGEIPHYHQPV